MRILTETFEVNGSYSDSASVNGVYGFVVFGTVEVELAGKTRRVPCRRFVGLTDSVKHLSGFTAYGLTGRYMTGTKAWPASLDLRDGWTHAQPHFGFDSRSGKHRKVSMNFAA